MLSDIKSQLNQMQSLQFEAAASSAEAIAEVVRTEIRRAMMVKGQSGLTIQDTIDAKIAHLGRDDYGEDRGGEMYVRYARKHTHRRSSLALELLPFLLSSCSSSLRDVSPYIFVVSHAAVDR